ncbi:hypothetical protein LMG2828_05841 [Achromobacter piechaudii]|nr:hypothetical protein LMG2828_05841 [Achromobacter piechaudii]
MCRTLELPISPHKGTTQWRSSLTGLGACSRTQLHAYSLLSRLYWPGQGFWLSLQLGGPIRYAVPAVIWLSTIDHCRLLTAFKRLGVTVASLGVGPAASGIRRCRIGSCLGSGDTFRPLLLSCLPKKFPFWIAQSKRLVAPARLGPIGIIGYTYPGSTGFIAQMCFWASCGRVSLARQGEKISLGSGPAFFARCSLFCTYAGWRQLFVHRNRFKASSGKGVCNPLAVRGTPRQACVIRFGGPFERGFGRRLAVHQHHGHVDGAKRR